MNNPALKNTKRRLTPEKREAVKRVLRLVDGYMGRCLDQDELCAWKGGMMTWGEIRRHVRAALKLL